MSDNNILCTEKIKELLPYRYPMLLIDRLQIESETRYIGLKNITSNEEVFNGHFPNHPILPGVLQIEAMKQVGELAVRPKLDPSNDGDIYIKSMKKVKFRRPNNPGDRIKIEVDITETTSDTATLAAKTINASGVTCQAEIVLSVRARQCPNTMPKLFTDYDKSENILMDINQIKATIPHRYPFLLVDYIISSENSHVIAVKNTSYGEPLFQGYKPEYAVLPGSVQPEIVAQAGCVTQLSKPKNKGKIAYFMSIQEAEFFHPIHPGDQLVCEVDIPGGQSKFGRGDGFIRVEDKIVSKATITFAIIDP